MLISNKLISRFRAVCLVAVMAWFCMFLPDVARAGLVIGGVTYTVDGPSETVIAPFTQPSTQSTNFFGGLVHIKVSGTGVAYLSPNLNDAFYLLNSVPNPDPNYYEMTMDNVALTGNPIQDVKNFIVYDVDGGNEVLSRPYKPGFRVDSTYSFVVDLGLVGVTSTSQLYFGVSDGAYGDNSGAFQIEISRLTQAAAVPEPASCIVAVLGMGYVGIARWRCRKRVRRACSGAVDTALD